MNESKVVPGLDCFVALYNVFCRYCSNEYMVCLQQVGMRYNCNSRLDT